MSIQGQAVRKTQTAFSTCPGCGHRMEVFFELPAVPVNSCLLVDTKEEALRFPRGDIALGFCAGCGFVSNQAFRPELTTYSGRYEETQAYSETFNKFHKALVVDLIDRLQLHGKRVVEIGCGKGEFLAMLCKLGNNHGLGFDPGFDDTRGTFEPDVDAKVIKGFFGPQHGHADSDFVCCKMTLEHITDTAKFVDAARGVLRPSPDSKVFFQVPEALRILRDCAFEDIYYEHCSYFTAGSLARLFRSQGFNVTRLDVAYGEQYLTIEGAWANGQFAPPLPVEEPAAQLAGYVADFNSRFAAKTAELRSLVETRAAQGPVVLWGSGSKAVSFLRAVQVPGAIEYIVDINPRRHGHFMPGTGQVIVGPSDLKRIAPRTVIAMNAVYRDEIARDLERNGVTTELLAL
jgi:SAM-dependent methyltransferase